jgi:hypothetical protein
MQRKNKIKTRHVQIHVPVRYYMRIISRIHVCIIIIIINCCPVGRDSVIRIRMFNLIVVQTLIDKLFDTVSYIIYYYDGGCSYFSYNLFSLKSKRIWCTRNEWQNEGNSWQLPNGVIPRCRTRTWSALCCCHLNRWPVQLDYLGLPRYVWCWTRSRSASAFRTSVKKGSAILAMRQDADGQ